MTDFDLNPSVRPRWRPLPLLPNRTAAFSGCRLKLAYEDDDRLVFFDRLAVLTAVPDASFTELRPLY